MLDAYIIDAIKREEAERAQSTENRLWIEVPEMGHERPAAEEEPESQRGPIVIPLYRDDDAADDAA